jgi:hypothetical protein
MGALTPTFLVNLETRMQVLTESEYQRMRQNLWWQKVAKVRPSTGLKEIITWLLSTAQIRDLGKGGNQNYDDLVSIYTSYENKVAGTALKLSRYQLEDTDGGGMDLAGQWATDIGAYMAYWPQKQCAYFLKNAHNLSTSAGFTAYDTKAFFASDHPVDGKNSSTTYANIFTGAASGSYPGACPIDASVTPDVALENLAKIFGYAATIKMPNGDDPRFLRPRGIICSPRLAPRVVQLTSAKFLAQAAASATTAGGSADVEKLISYMGYGLPIQADELAGFESDTTYYVVMEQATTSQLGPIIYSDREAFRVNFYGVMDQVELGRKQELEWQCSGRNVVAPGHPYLLFKCKGS